MIMKSGLSLTFALCQLRVRSTWHNPELGIREILYGRQDERFRAACTISSRTQTDITLDSD
jgi:hypothetical protein